MAEIPGVVWLAIGGVVTVVSLLMPQLIVFIVIGVIFLLIGLVKLIRSGMRKPKNNHTYHRTDPKTEKEVLSGSAKACFVCGAKNAAQANFCGHCGHRL